MALVRHDRREVQFTIAYFGPPQGGKSTNLRYLHRRLDPALRGDLISITAGGDHFLAFDFFPVHETVLPGYRTRFQLRTATPPGQGAARSAPLPAGIDGIVFVADSTPCRQEANLEAWRFLQEVLGDSGPAMGRLPVVHQYNKRDRPGATSPEDLDESFGVRGPAFLSCALTGHQVFATLDWISSEILRRFHASIPEERTARGEPGAGGREKRIRPAGVKVP